MNIHDRIKLDIERGLNFHWHRSDLLRNLFESSVGCLSDPMSLVVPFELLFRERFAQAPRLRLTQEDFARATRLSDSPQYPKTAWFDIDSGLADGQLQHEGALTFEVSSPFGYELPLPMLLVILFSGEDTFQVHGVTLPSHSVTPSNLQQSFEDTGILARSVQKIKHALNVRPQPRQHGQLELQLINAMLQKTWETWPDLNLN